jgi:hypothetical protein
MKKKLFFIIAVLVVWGGAEAAAQTAQSASAAGAAQTAKAVRPAGQGLEEIRFGVGVRGAVDRTLRNGSPEIVSLSYARYNQKGLGFRTGLEFMPSNMKIDSYFGVPVAFSARTRSRTFSQSVRTGLESAAVGAVRDAVYGYEPNARSIAGDFILGMFNRAEFFAGITPGYVFGTGSSRSKSDDGMAITEQRVDLVNRFAISADAGFSMSFLIWQFNLSIVPAVHYFLTKNYIYISETTPIDGGASKITETPVRFQYSVLGALGFNF